MYGIVKTDYDDFFFLFVALEKRTMKMKEIRGYDVLCLTCPYGNDLLLRN